MAAKSLRVSLRRQHQIEAEAELGRALVKLGERETGGIGGDEETQCRNEIVSDDEIAIKYEARSIMMY